MRAREFALMEGRLKDLAAIGTNMPDADFWLVRRGSENAVGRPVREFNPEHIGVRVTAEDRVDANYLYYVMQYLHMQGVWRDRAHGTLNLKNIRTQDVKDIAVG